MSQLYIIALPIGNILDLTLRAKKILEEVDIIAAEDTRKFKTLARNAKIHYKAKVISHYSYNEKPSTQEILKFFDQNKTVALVSDGGTPRISDPGFHLIKSSWEAKNPIDIKPIPGASCLTSILSISPFKNTPLLFLGYLSHKKSHKKRIFLQYLDFKGSIVFLESVHRIQPTLIMILEIWGDLNILIGREMTKTYEEYFIGKLKQAIEWVEKKKGEFTLVLDTISK